MDLLFGRRKTPEELLRQNQRALARAMRELDRERQKLEAQEKKIIVDIKKMAKQGQMVREHQRGTRRGHGGQQESIVVVGEYRGDKGTREGQGDKEGTRG